MFTRAVQQSLHGVNSMAIKPRNFSALGDLEKIRKSFEELSPKIKGLVMNIEHFSKRIDYIKISGELEMHCDKLEKLREELSAICTNPQKNDGVIPQIVALKADIAAQELFCSKWMEEAVKAGDKAYDLNNPSWCTVS